MILFTRASCLPPANAVRRKTCTIAFRHFAADHAASEREDIGVVVFPRVARHELVRATRTTHPRDLVHDHARPDTGAIDHDAESRPAACHADRHGMCKVRIVAGLGAPRSDIFHTNADDRA